MYLDFYKAFFIPNTFHCRSYNKLLRETITKMLINKEIREELNELIYLLKLQDKNKKSSLDKQVKIEQNIAYTEQVAEITQEPDYGAALSILSSLAG